MRNLLSFDHKTRISFPKADVWKRVKKNKFQRDHPKLYIHYSSMCTLRHTLVHGFKITPGTYVIDTSIHMQTRKTTGNRYIIQRWRLIFITSIHKQAWLDHRKSLQLKKKRYKKILQWQEKKTVTINHGKENIKNPLQQY